MKSLLRANKGFADIETSEHADNVTEIYDRHIDTVYRVCFSLLGNKQDAEDATQSVFIKLLNNTPTFNDVEHEKAWLIITARNHCRDLHRKWWKWKMVDTDLNLIEITDSETVLSKEMEEYLRKLPPTYRLVLYLFYYEGYKITEIAEMLKLNINTVKTRLRSARKRLKLEIGDDYDE